MVKIVSKNDTTLPVKNDASIVPKPTDLILCNKIKDITIDARVHVMSRMTLSFPKSFLKRMASAPIKPS